MTIEAVQLSLGTAAAELCMTRDVLRRIVTEAGVQPTGARGGHPLYRLRDLYRAILSQGDGIDANPHSRLALARAIKTEDEIRVRRGDLVEVYEHERECALLAMAFCQWADTLPDLIERDIGASPLVIAKVERSIDDLRTRLADWLETLPEWQQ